MAPNANSVTEFEQALRVGRSGIRFVPKLAELNFACQVAGIPQGVDERVAAYFDSDESLAMNSNHRYASVAAVDAWTDAGFERPTWGQNGVHWDTGAILGTGVGGLDTVGERVVPMTNAGKVRRLGSTMVEQIMASGISARVSGILALGNRVTTNSSACSTGTEALVEGSERIRNGRATRMLCGGSEGASHYIWAGFDSMRVLCRTFNEAPERASRPLSTTAGGFVPAAGAGVVLLEDAETAVARGARIYAEVLGGATNCGGHRSGGSMTAPNPDGVRRCIRAALDDAAISGDDVDAINGHFTGTGGDPKEVQSWAAALERPPDRFPYLLATKSLIGHALGGAGGIESVAAILMLYRGFLQPSINCEDLHPEIEPYAAAIPRTVRDVPDLRTMVKAGFGFGDVNACIVFRRWDGAEHLHQTAGGKSNESQRAAGLQ